ncbi:hypothetical protein [Allorhizocola rhizosphaerae]|uniref:hypothetical protein n=1 Tax=Allorhizocola rhizosphaerae TaxID=1872709 RepID=UPI000E3BEB4D|nr:hypothetical protein [Allorhizocola rhizosphaerae]
MNRKKFVAGGLVAAGLLSVLGLAAWEARQASAHADSHYLIDHLRSRSHATDAVWVETSFAEMLPSQSFSVNGAPAAPRGSGVVIGRITDVRAGRGFAHPDDAPKSTQVDFNAPDALWRTVQVTLAVEEAWGKVAGQRTVTFAVIIDRGADATAAMNGLRALERVVVSLDRQGRHAYAPDMYSISRNGDMFGTVDAQGNIQLPVMDDATVFMQGLDTVAELRTAAGHPSQTIRVDLVEGAPTRR